MHLTFPDKNKTAVVKSSARKKIAVTTQVNDLEVKSQYLRLVIW